MDPALTLQRSGIAGSFCLGGILIVFLTRQVLTETLRFSVSYTGTAGIPNKESKMQCFLGVHPWEPCQSLWQFLGEALGREIRVWGSEEAGNAHCHAFSLVSCSHSSGLAKNLWNGNTQGPEGSRFGGRENFTACLLRKGCNLIIVV